VRRAFSIVCLFFAWLCAIGAVWDGVQIFAWAHMFAGYAAKLPVSEALRATFDPAKPCTICQAVAKAKETEQKQAPQQAVRTAEKLLLACDTPTQIFVLQPRVEWPPAAADPAPSRTEAVPVPPPRLLIA
jgi:hypothetical protein